MPASARSIARSITSCFEKRLRSFGTAAGGAVASAHARPSRPSAASRNSFGRALASAGSTSDSGESGMPSSPTAVLKAKRPARLPSPSSVAAVTFPVSAEMSEKLTVAASPGAMASISCVASPTSRAPAMLRG